MLRLEKHSMSNVRMCFEELRGFFTQEQALKVITVMLSIMWINNDQRYFNEQLKTLRNSGEYGFGYKLSKSLEEFENQYPEFKDLLTGLIDSVLNYPDKNVDRKLRIVFEIVESMNLNSQEEVKSAIKYVISLDEYHRINDTPESMAVLVFKLLNFDTIKRMAVYCCATSKIALTISENLRSRYSDKYLYYYGEEIVLTTTLISRLLMIIFGIRDSEIRNKDVLFYDYQEFHDRYDLVITDIPQISYPEEALNYHDERLKYGKPTRNSAEWSFGQNVIYHMDKDGIGIIIGTKGMLVRNNEVEIRRRIIDEDLIECVITLPNNLYEKSSIGSEMIIFNKKKPEERKNKILFINASKENMRLNRLQHTITEEGIEKITSCYKEGIEKAHFSRFVDTEKIKEFNYTLNPVEYLDFDVLKKSLNESVALKEIAQISRGLNIKKQDLVETNDEDAYYYLNIRDIENGRVKYNGELKVLNKKNEWIGKYDIRPNDIIVTSKGWTVKFAIVEEDFKPSFISSNLTRIRVDPRKYNPYVLLEFFQSEIGTKMIEGIHTGTTVMVLSIQQLERFEIPMFNIEQMNYIGEKIRDSRMEYENSIKEAQRRFEESKNEYTEMLTSHISKDS